MRAANDDNPCRDWLDLVALNRQLQNYGQPGMPWSAVWRLKGQHTRQAGNFVWFLKFEASFNRDRIEQRRAEMRVVQP